MLEIKKLSAGYGKRCVIENLSLKAESGKITVIAGKNGCGKTTLAKAVVGQKSYSGQILISGQEISSMKPKERAKRIAFLPQKLYVPHVTVADLVMFGRNPYREAFKHPSEEDFERCSQAMVLTDTKVLSDRLADSISGGELQRVYIAMILAQDTDVIMLDEPATYMDISNNRMLFDILRKSKKTVVVITHDLAGAMRFADKIAVMENRTAVFEGTAEECLESGVLESVFDIKVHIFRKNGRVFTAFE